MVDIDKNVPIPDSASSPRSTYPWGEMEPGDSFVPTTTNTRTISPMVAKANARLHPKRFVWGRDEEGNIRIWRAE